MHQNLSGAIRMTIAKLFNTGRSQAVRLPKEFRFEGKEVRIRRFGLGVLLQPVRVNVDELFAALDRSGAPFMADGRDQPVPQERDAFP
jgi:antitoxin VapB